jgi:hypothetical protein
MVSMIVAASMPTTVPVLAVMAMLFALNVVDPLRYNRNWFADNHNGTLFTDHRDFCTVNHGPAALHGLIRSPSRRLRSPTTAPVAAPTAVATVFPLPPPT